VRRIAWILISIVFALPLSMSVAQGSLPSVNVAALTQPIVMSSSEVSFPLDERMAANFSAAGFPGSIEVILPGGTVEAIQQYCAGSVDLVSTDRPFSDEELASCRANGRDPIAFQVGSDALVIGMSVLSPLLDDIATAEVMPIFSTATNWSEVRPELPEAVIQRVLPVVDAYEFGAFTDALFNGAPEPLLSASNTVYLDPGEAQLAAVENDANAIGVFSFSFYSQYAGISLKALRLDGAAPTVDTISNGSYPLSTPIFIYSDTATMVNNLSVTGFINYYLTNVDAELRRLGYFPNRNGLERARNNWLQVVADQQITLPTSSDPALTELDDGDMAAEEVITEEGMLPGEGEVIAGGEGEIIEETGGAPEAASTESGAPATAQLGEALPILIDARADLELLMTTVLAFEQPQGWNGSLDVNDPALPVLIRADLELLAGTVLGADQRPPDWFGPVPSTRYNIARDIRHDIELLADALIGEGQRPDGWTGGDPLFECSRSTQALVNMLERGGVFTLSLDANAPDYCEQAEVQASQFSEVNLLATVSDQPLFNSSTQAAIPGTITVETNFAVSFLDRGARLSVGAIPIGTAVRPVARSYVQFSRMAVVEGDGFLVFVDYRDTTMTEDQFDNLGNVNDIALETFCIADWCGPGSAYIE